MSEGRMDEFLSLSCYGNVAKIEENAKDNQESLLEIPNL
jgi:hypothetical protein